MLDLLQSESSWVIRLTLIMGYLILTLRVFKYGSALIGAGDFDSGGLVDVPFVSTRTSLVKQANGF